MKRTYEHPKEKRGQYARDIGLKISRVVSAVNEINELKCRENRICQIERSQEKRRADVKERLFKKSGGDDFIVANAVSIGQCLSSLCSSAEIAESPEEASAYIAGMRAIIYRLSTHGKASDPRNFVFTAVSSHVIRKTGVELFCSGIDNLILLSAGYRLVCQKTGAVVTMPDHEIVFTYPQSGVGNRKTIQSVCRERLSAFMAHCFQVDLAVPDTDCQNINRGLCEAFLEMKNGGILGVCDLNGEHSNYSYRNNPSGEGVFFKEVQGEEPEEIVGIDVSSWLQETGESIVWSDMKTPPKLAG